MLKSSDIGSMTFMTTKRMSSEMNKQWAQII